MNAAHVIFENVGEIDPLLIRTFGVNVKEGDGAIGFFGTGLKYALAILIRMGIQVTIQSGAHQFEFGKYSKTIRGKDFDFVAMNGEPLGFTTEVGKNWKLWMAYRELYCNCQDEGGRSYESDAVPSPRAGWTRVIVAGDAFLEITRNHSAYFITSKEFASIGSVNVHRGANQFVFYRKVNVGNLGGKGCCHTYNITKGIDLTEDRTLKSQSDVSRLIAEAIGQCDDPDLIRSCITAPDIYQESNFDFNWFYKPSETFMTVVEDLLSTSATSINQSARDLYLKHSKKVTEPAMHTMNQVEEKMLARAVQFSKRIGFDVDDYPIRIVKSLGAGCIGMAKNGKIYVAQRAFSTGTKYVAATLIEEFLHLKHGLNDCSREMQNHLFDLVVSLGEQVIGEPV